MTLAASPLAESASARCAAPLPYEAAPWLIAVAIFALCAFSPAIFNDGDTWSHVATGEWMLAHRAIPRADPFTFSFAGAPWTAHEWLSELLMALAFRAAGWGGVALLTGAAAALALYVVTARVVRDLAGPAVAILAVLAIALLGPSLLARPHILALPLFAFWVAVLLAAREREAAPSLSFAAVMALWANLHGGFAFGLALIAPFALEALIEAPAERRLAVVRDWGLFGLTSVAAALLTPFGVEGLLFPIKLLGLHALSQIGEWAPESFARPNALELAMLGLLGLALVRPVRVQPMRALILVGLLHMSLGHARHEMLLAVIAPMLLARPIADALGAPPARARASLAMALAVAIALIVGARVLLPLQRGDAPNSPAAALASVPEDIRAKPDLNGYSFGGYLIFEGVKPFIDGRADMFGDDFLDRYAPIARGDRDALEEALKRYDIAWTIFPPSLGAVSAMDREPGWRRLYADRYAVVHVREAHGPAAP